MGLWYMMKTLMIKRCTIAIYTVLCMYNAPSIITTATYIAIYVYSSSNYITWSKFLTLK